MIYYLLIGAIACSAPQVHSQSSSGDGGLPPWVAVLKKQEIKLKKETHPCYWEVKGAETVTIIRPKPLTSASELELLNPGLTGVLPNLSGMLSSAEVSGKFERLYDAKIDSLSNGGKISSLDYFDCATVLHLTHKTTGRKAVLFQADMDVDTDGTDPLRLPLLADYDDARLSKTFQPVLSYSWEKESSSPENPFIHYYADTLANLKKMNREVVGYAENDKGFVWMKLKAEFDAEIKSLQHKITDKDEDLRERRSLIAALDPFIVVPGGWTGKDAPFDMQVGDYVAAIYRGKVYPAIVGDTGGVAQAGEASLKLAKAVDGSASGKRAAVETPGVSYLIFPHTKDAQGLPDKTLYHIKIKQLLNELGGSRDVEVYPWKDKED